MQSMVLQQLYRILWSQRFYNGTQQLLFVGVLIVVLSAGVQQRLADAADPAETSATFFRGLNLNGPAVVIDGNSWEGRNSANYRSRDKAFENQSVTLLPSTDAARALMIRSSRWGGNRLALTNIPNGEYSVFLYVWEDNDPETFSIAVNGKSVLKSFNSGKAGQWQRLGPWYVRPDKGQIVLTSRGGAANFSGVEIWKGRHDGSAKPEIPGEQLAFFESRVRPLLVRHCYACHSERAETVEGRLLLDSAPTMRQGGISGPAVVPGDADNSLIIQAVRYSNPDMQMPPDGKLSDDEISTLEKWVRMGAPDPRHAATYVPQKTIDVAKARQFWSLRPVTRPSPPIVKNSRWPLTEIDRFILAQLEQRQIPPVDSASRRTLIRRASYDLTGLPPSPEEVADFENDAAPLPAAFERVVERLLASRHYGERWGRHWMDLVRYADTAGDNSDYPIPQAYRYRNYIIDSFNQDKPYDTFLQEQIAGDLLPATDEADRNENVVATGYIAIARRFGSVIKDYPQHLTIEDTIDNMGRVVLGLTLSCSRCHDHKFDPVLQTDYYGLYGIFESTRYPFPGIELDKKPRDFVPLLAGGKPTSELAYAVAEGQVADTRLQVRGEPDQQGDVVPRKFLDVLGGQRLSPQEAKSSGRLQLARWLTSQDNPLTARVMVNRIWHYHFGRGLVATVSDFGSRGEVPSHPELLDWLASEFMEHNWSINWMHRLIMKSRVYQLDSRLPDIADAEHHPGLTADPDAVLRWRYHRQTLDAESLRDSLLLFAGNLDLSPATEPHPFPPADKWQYTQHHPFRDAYPTNRRSVYLMTARLNKRPWFAAFDGPDRNASTAKRDSSVTAVQSLYLLNDEFIHAQAGRFADRLLEAQKRDSDRITRAFRIVFCRDPSHSEVETCASFLQQAYQTAAGAHQTDSERQRAAWSALTRALLRSNEFLYVD